MSFDAAALDRLPWLSDGPARQWGGRGRGSLLPWAAGGLAVVAAGVFLSGRNAIEEIVTPSRHQQPSTTVLLPPARAAARAQPRVTGNPKARAASEVAKRVRPRGAARIVEVGAFGSVQKAERGWRVMVRTDPQMAHAPAVVRRTRNSHGREFYRFQVGMASQGHSRVLCQRMRTINLGCAVLAKAKVER